MVYKTETKFRNSGWCFAIVNGRLAELYFDKKWGPHGHAYVKRKEFNKHENKMIDADIKKYKFTYRNKFYYDQIRKIKNRAPNREELYPDLKKSFKKSKTLDRVMKEFK